MRLPFLIVISLWASSCATTTVRVVLTDPGSIKAPIERSNSLSSSKATVTIFLLERDIPTDIKRLGIVYIYPINTRSKTDEVVKQALQQQCQQLGANGAYRVTDGYYPDTRRAEIPYLVFRYVK